MKCTYNWLTSYSNIDLTCNEVCDILSTIGFESSCDTTWNKSMYSQFIVGNVIEVLKHPNADRLQICKVDIGKAKPLQIICGAKNVKNNMKAVVAPIGSTLPIHNIKIKKTIIRGIESEGMLCSSKELMLTEDDNNILELDEQAEIGQSIDNIFDIDTIIDIDITPNRGDCLSVYGITRELYAADICKPKKKFLSFENLTFPSNNEHTIDLLISDKKNCQEAAFCYISGVNNEKDDHFDILKIYNSLNIKSNSALVDISNFAMYEYGRPNHMYDASKIEGNLIEIRQSIKGEKFVSLEDKEYILPEGILVIADKYKILSIAGVMGGKYSKVDKHTKDIIVEVADFNPKQIAKSIKLLNIKSESSFRFERKIDQSITEQFMGYLSEKILHFCGGSVLWCSLLKGKQLDYINKVAFNYADAQKIIGKQLNIANSNRILEKLGFKINKDKQDTQIKIPSWRLGDITDSAGIIEEITRIDMIGDKTWSNKIEYEKPPEIPDTDKLNLLRKALVYKNLYEVINWSFVNKDINKIFSNNEIEIANPINKTLSSLRGSLIPNLIVNINDNINRGTKDIGIFEIGKIFTKENNNILEKTNLTIARTGNIIKKGPLTEERKLDFYDIKDDFKLLIEELNLTIEDFVIDRKTPDYYHPGISSAFYLNNKLIAFLGAIHPKVQNYLNIKQNLYCLECFIEELPSLRFDYKKKISLNNLPSVNRDFSFLIDRKVDSVQIIDSIKNLNISFIKNIEIFDIYYNSSESKSVGVRIVLQPKNTTFTDAEIEKITNTIVINIETKLNAKLRYQK